MSRRFRSLREDRIERPRFMLDQLLVEGVLNIVAGESGIGKSTLVLDWVAKATKGTLKGDHEGRPMNVCLYSPEDSRSMLKARLLAAGADVQRVIPIGECYTEQGEEVACDYLLPGNIKALEEALMVNSSPFLVIDPLSNLVGGDGNKRDDVRKALNPLAALAMRLDVTVVGLLHFGKAMGRNARHMVSGSHAYIDICRSLLTMAQDPETGQVTVSQDKANYSSLPVSERNWCFHIESAELTDDDGEPMSVGRVAGWEHSDRSVTEVANTSLELDTDEPNDCQQFIIDYYDQHARATPDGQGYGFPSSEVIAAGSGEYPKQQLKDARRRCREYQFRSKRFGDEWWWFTVDACHLATLPPSSVSNGFQGGTRWQGGKPTQPVPPSTQPNDSNASQPPKPLRWQGGTAHAGKATGDDPEPDQNDLGDDITVFLSALPQFVGGVDFDKMTNRQLLAIKNHKPGLWHNKALEELTRRKSSDLPMQPVPAPHGPQVGKAA
ncbi:AAA family ATPase [Bifidobacterium asteroides]|uniref:AAA family ATPase n=1 Tax=Bifidobacterium asteroides TaxID=1684 RepID=UPI001C6A01C0|nr:AAA family ATPase [Bifidobacterium asteroides]QYN59883.1 AAA family ATPase [Bifidobacterium asteroides]